MDVALLVFYRIGDRLMNHYENWYIHEVLHGENFCGTRPSNPFFFHIIFKITISALNKVEFRLNWTHLKNIHRGRS